MGVTSNNEILKVPRELKEEAPFSRSKSEFYDRLENFCHGWDDIIIPGLSFKVDATAPDLITFYGSGSIVGFAFDGTATTEQAYATCEMTHKYIEGTNLRPHIHWMPTTAAAGNVVWNIDYVWTNFGDTASAPTTISILQAASGTAWKHQIAGFAEIDGTGKQIGSQMHFRLYRNPGAATDTYGADAAFLTFGFHYRANSIGSQQEYTK